jgi:hypothetical protein
LPFNYRRPIFGKCDPSLCRQISSYASSPADTHSTLRTSRRSPLEDREKQLRKQIWSQDVGYILQLIALRALAAWTGDHDAGIVPEDVESVFLAQELFGGGFDGGEVREVELEEVEGAF